MGKATGGLVQHSIANSGIEVILISICHNIKFCLYF